MSTGSSGLSFSGDLLSLFACWRCAPPEDMFPQGYNLDSRVFSWQAAAPASFSFLFLPTFNDHLLLYFLFPLWLQVSFFCCQPPFAGHLSVFASVLACLLLLALAFNMCCLMAKSISSRLSLMMCIQTILSGSLVAAS